jgi:hypothetical protein
LYLLERCSGTDCSNWAEIGSAAGNTYNDTGLKADTVYRYRVRARDGAGNTSGYSTVLTTTTAPKEPTCI